MVLNFLAIFCVVESHSVTMIDFEQQPKCKEIKDALYSIKPQIEFQFSERRRIVEPPTAENRHGYDAQEHEDVSYPLPPFDQSVGDRHVSEAAKVQDILTVLDRIDCPWVDCRQGGGGCM